MHIVHVAYNLMQDSALTPGIRYTIQHLVSDIVRDGTLMSGITFSQADGAEGAFLSGGVPASIRYRMHGREETQLNQQSQIQAARPTHYCLVVYIV
jgi:hypothetical protein